MPITNLECPETHVHAICTFDPSMDPPMESTIFKGLMATDDLTVWLGREKHRKSNLLLQLAICAATGKDFLTARFMPTKPLRVTYIDYESKTGSLKLRYDAIVKAMGLTEEEQRILSVNLLIIEVRKMRKEGRFFPRFPKRDLDREVCEFWKRLIAETGSDLYIIDPLRCFHGEDENDSKLEALLEQVRRYFGAAGVVISHHMRKESSKRDQRLSLSQPGTMREWSDGCRGSVAIKAHSDVIVCQERVIEKETEIVYLGAFMKDGEDIEPMPLRESDEGAFFFKVTVRLSPSLRVAYDTLCAHSAEVERTVAIQILQNSGTARATAYRHLNRLQNLGLLTESNGSLCVQTPNVETG